MVRWVVAEESDGEGVCPRAPSFGVLSGGEGREAR